MFCRFNFSPTLILPFPILLFYFHHVVLHLFQCLCWGDGQCRRCQHVMVSLCQSLFITLLLCCSSLVTAFRCSVSSTDYSPPGVSLSQCGLAKQPESSQQYLLQHGAPPSMSASPIMPLKMFLSTFLPLNFSRCVSSYFSFLRVLLYPFPHLLLLPALCITCISFWASKQASSCVSCSS